MTTRPGHRRSSTPARFAVLLAAALFGAAAQADAAVTASVVANQLRVVGDAAADVIDLRLSANDQSIEVRRGSTLVGSFLRSTFTSIRVDAGGGDDELIIVIDNILAPINEPMTIEGGRRQRHPRGWLGRRHDPRRRRQRHHRGEQSATTSCSVAPATTASGGDRGIALRSAPWQRHHRRRVRHRHAGSPRPVGLRRCSLSRPAASAPC